EANWRAGHYSVRRLAVSVDASCRWGQKLIVSTTDTQKVRVGMRGSETKHLYWISFLDEHELHLEMLFEIAQSVDLMTCAGNLIFAVFSDFSIEAWDATQLPKRQVVQRFAGAAFSLRTIHATESLL